MSEWKLSSEVRFTVPLPPQQAFADSFKDLDPGYNSFYVLEDKNGNYMQCGGGQKACTVEMHIRKPRGGDKHYIIGFVGGSTEPAEIPMSTGVIEVQKNEVLQVSDAVELFEIFFKGGDIPPKYGLREAEF